MKKFIFALFMLFFTLSINAQSKKDLKYEIYKLEKQVSEIKTLKSENQRLTSENEALKTENRRLSTAVSLYRPNNPNISIEPNDEESGDDKPSSVIKGQCKAITAAGTQCKRSASEGSDYCWQHQGNSGSKSSVKSSGTSTGSSTGSGRTIQTGPRGGKYYINKNGNKTYIKH